MKISAIDKFLWWQFLVVEIFLAYKKYSYEKDLKTKKQNIKDEIFNS